MLFRSAFRTSFERARLSHGTKFGPVLAWYCRRAHRPTEFVRRARSRLRRRHCSECPFSLGVLHRRQRYVPPSISLTRFAQDPFYRERTPTEVSQALLASEWHIASCPEASTFNIMMNLAFDCSTISHWTNIFNVIRSISSLLKAFNIQL